jgi:hypothetical protein
VGRVIHSLEIVRSKIIEVSFDYILEIVKSEGHVSLEGFSDVFKAERHYSVCESTPMTNKFHLMLILRFDLNLIVS